jgi:hypothetical protein
MKNKLGLLASALVLSACATESGVKDYPKDPVAKGLAFSYSKSFDQSRINSVEPKVVRSVVQDEDKTVREIAGAVCTISSSEMSIKVTTPSEVLLPVIKGEPKPLQIACQSGKLRANEEMKAFIPQAQSTPTYTGEGGVAGALLTVLVFSAGDAMVNASRKSADLWRYRHMAVNEILIPLK